MSVKKDLHNEDVSILSGGVKIEGNLSSDGNVRIDGTVIGNVKVNGNLTIGETAKIVGEVFATNITLGGNIEGKVNASDTFRLESKSSLKGDLITRRLVIEDGALFDGHSSMNNVSRPTIKPE